MAGSRRALRGFTLAAVAVSVVVLAACTSSQPDTAPTQTVTETRTVTAEPTTEPSGTSPTPTESTPAPGPRRANAKISPVTDRLWDRMVETGTWRSGCPAGREDLVRIRVNYHKFNGNVKRGMIVANKDVAEDLAAIFTALFEANFPFKRIRPADAYGGDVNAGLAANNTSAFNCRKDEQINAPVLQSPHANGRAIDINPLQNPWLDKRCDCWMPSDAYAENREGPGVILEGGLVWTLFTERGWIWQDIKVPDYMHFDTGFPSRPWHGTSASPSPRR